jgi:hypothetical protein
MIRDLAEADGITSSDVVRMFVRRLHAERFGTPNMAQKPKPKRK